MAASRRCGRGQVGGTGSFAISYLRINGIRGTRVCAKLMTMGMSLVSSNAVGGAAFAASFTQWGLRLGLLKISVGVRGDRVDFLVAGG